MGTTLEDYFQAQKENLAGAMQFEPFKVLFHLVHDLYTRAISLIPQDNVFGQFVLMAHKEFLAAASLIGQAQPDEAAPITRRAIEMVRVAQAVKHDPENAKKWLAFEERMARWRARREGEKPKTLHIELSVGPHPIIEELMKFAGMLSDSGAHFTPEFFASRNWSKRDGQLFLDYFNGDQRTIEREIVLLAALQLLILRVLDECVDHAFGKDADWSRMLREAQAWGKRFGAKFEPPATRQGQAPESPGSPTPR